MIDWKELDKEQPPFGDWPRKGNRLLLIEKTTAAMTTNCEVGYLQSIDRKGMHFVDDNGNDLDEGGDMVNPMGNPFNPTRWAFINLP